MNLAASAPAWLFALLALTLVAAAIQDMTQLKIANVLVAAVILLAAIAVALVGPGWALWQNLLLFAVLLAIGTFAFSAGIFGGGDVKLIAALGLWVGLAGALRLLVTIAIAGGVLALVFMVVRQVMRKPGTPKPKGQLPYGVAIAAGALLAFQMQRWDAERVRSLPPIPVLPSVPSASVS